MSTLLSKIKNLFSGFKKSGSSYDRKRIRPARDWRMIFVTSILFVILLAGVATYFYIEIDAGKLFITQNNTSESEIKINTVLLKKTVDDLNKRENAYADIESSISTPPDPSL